MRKEKDSMGDMQIPDDAYYGAQTQRAVENFPISGITISKSMIQALGKIKRSAAIVNHELGLLDDDRKNAIVQAADEIIEGNFAGTESRPGDWWRNTLFPGKYGIYKKFRRKHIS